jgi:hypothetical protein
VPGEYGEVARDQVLEFVDAFARVRGAANFRNGEDLGGFGISAEVDLVDAEDGTERRSGERRGNQQQIDVRGDGDFAMRIAGVAARKRGSAGPDSANRPCRVFPACSLPVFSLC